MISGVEMIYQGSAKLLAMTIAVLLVAMPAFADEAGMVKSSQGKATIERDGKFLEAVPGAKIYSSDRVTTGADGRAGIALKDNTLLTVGPNSSLSLDRFAFDSTTHQGALQASIRQGTLAVVSGKLAKASPESVQFRTPNSILGVRGTEFVVEVGVSN